MDLINKNRLLLNDIEQTLGENQLNNTVQSNSMLGMSEQNSNGNVADAEGAEGNENMEFEETITASPVLQTGFKQKNVHKRIRESGDTESTEDDGLGEWQEYKKERRGKKEKNIDNLQTVKRIWRFILLAKSPFPSNSRWHDFLKKTKLKTSHK